MSYYILYLLTRKVLGVYLSNLMAVTLRTLGLWLNSVFVSSSGKFRLKFLIKLVVLDFLYYLLMLVMGPSFSS